MSNARFRAGRLVSGLLSVGLGLLLLDGCSPAQALCAKEQECNDELEDDTYNVCIESYNAGINALRANEEPECQVLADARLALDACRATLSCSDFEDNDLDDCDDQLDDFRDAEADTVDSRGNSICSSSN